MTDHDACRSPKLAAVIGLRFLIQNASAQGSPIALAATKAIGTTASISKKIPVKTRTDVVPINDERIIVPTEGWTMPPAHRLMITLVNAAGVAKANTTTIHQAGAFVALMIIGLGS